MSLSQKNKEIEFVAKEIVKKAGGKTTRGEMPNINTLYSFGALRQD